MAKKTAKLHGALHVICAAQWQRILITGLLVTAAIVYPGFSVAADSESDITTMVVMAPTGPVFVRMQILVDGRSYRLWVSQFLAGKLDIDGDGQLTGTELDLIPQQLLRQTQVASGQELLKLAAEQDDSAQITTDVFNQWFSDRLSRSYSIIAGAVRISDAVRLAGLIDANGDGAVTQTELLSGSRTLRFRDLDDDQTFTAAELMPYRDPRNQQAAVTPDVANLPFVQITDKASVERTSEQILKRYGNGLSVHTAAMRMPDTVVSPVDSDHNDQLNNVECQALLQAPAYHLELDVLLSDRSNASRIDVRVAEFATDFCQASSERRGRTRLTLDDMPTEIRARGGGTGTRRFFTSFLLQRMNLYDTDKNNYLSEEEFPPMQQQMAEQQIAAQFADVDLNGDGMLFREELQGYIERDAISTQSRIEVSVRQDGKTLFSLLDSNTDRRLTPREFLEGFEELKKYDLNGDARLVEAELGTSYVLEIGLAQSDILRVESLQNSGMMAQSTDAVLPGVDGLNGPEWFRRMDRNQDRDVSAREFLGPQDIFRQLDSDADNLLSAKEASALQKTP